MRNFIYFACFLFVSFFFISSSVFAQREAPAVGLHGHGHGRESDAGKMASERIKKDKLASAVIKADKAQQKADIATEKAIKAERKASVSAERIEKKSSAQRDRSGDGSQGKEKVQMSTPDICARRPELPRCKYPDGGGG